MKRSIFILTSLILLGCSRKTEVTSDSKTGTSQSDRPSTPNIIFLIGDGMGLSQISSAYYYMDREPNFSRFKTIGFSKTSSKSHKITDSAAGATAFSIGQKSYNGAIGVDIDTNAVKTIAEELSENGWSTGVISTSSITHATPASFYAHVKNRRLEEEIATNLVNSNIDFFAGGGKKWFFNRSDNANYMELLIDKGYQIDTNSLDANIEDYSKRYGYLLAADGMPKISEGRGDFLYNASEKAINYLDNKEQPYFLMIEGSQIDWGGHDNDADYVISELIDFNKTIGMVLDYAEKQGNTLVVITADHETGGFTLSGKPYMKEDGKSSNDYNVIQPTFSTDGHSGTMVPVFSYGPGSEMFAGIYENTAIHSNFRQISGLEE